MNHATYTIGTIFKFLVPRVARDILEGLREQWVNPSHVIIFDEADVWIRELILWCREGDCPNAVFHGGHGGFCPPRRTMLFFLGFSSLVENF